MTAGNGKIVFVGLDAISTMLAGINPSDYITPHEKPNPKNHVVGKATDGIKRLATLREQTNSLLRPLLEEQGTLHLQVQTMFLGVSSLSQLSEVASSDEFVRIGKRLDEIKIAVVEPSMIGAAADKLLWLEIRKAFPELADKPAVGFDSKWNVYWSQGNDNSRRSSDIVEIIAALAERYGGGVSSRLM